MKQEFNIFEWYYRANLFTYEVWLMTVSLLIKSSFQLCITKKKAISKIKKMTQNRK